MTDYQKMWTHIKYEFLEQEIKHREQLIASHSEPNNQTVWQVELNMLNMVLRVMDFTEKYAI